MARLNQRTQALYILVYNRSVTQYSIAEARKHLAEIVDDALDGEPARITRRGRDVAVLVSAEEYDRLRAGKRSFAEAYAAYRAEFPEGRHLEPGEPDILPEYWDGLRDRSPGRESPF